MSNQFFIRLNNKDCSELPMEPRIYYLIETDFDAFETALTEPLPDNHKLAALLSEPSPWE